MPKNRNVTVEQDTDQFKFKANSDQDTNIVPIETISLNFEEVEPTFYELKPLQITSYSFHGSGMDTASFFDDGFLL